MTLRPAEIDKMLIVKGIKPTPNRTLVYRELAETKYPLSLSDLESRLAPTDKASIFRVLELFASAGVVHVFEDGSRSLKYELCHNDNHESNSDLHVHFYCVRCKRTICLDSVSVPAVVVPSGFDVQSVNYLLKGVCPDCSRSAKQK